MSYKSTFDEGFYDYHGIGELTCPVGWTPAWVEDPREGILDRPEYDLKDASRGHSEVRTGDHAANFFNVHATHNGCLYRKFFVGKGSLVRASVWCMNVTHDDRGGDGGHGMRIGIDPTGGTEHTADTVVYGDYWSSYMKDQGWEERKWHQVETEAVSQVDEVTVFLHAQCDYPVDINASHWDDFEIDARPAPAPIATPTPTTETAPGTGLTLEALEAMFRRVLREELDRPDHA
jgi:hypothetical protein